MRSLGVALLLLLALASSARAETRRIAVLVANNVGSGARPPLRYAENDAHKLGQTLTELGGVRSEDLITLNGRSLDSVRATLDDMRRRIERYHQKPQTRVVVLFYFSGHSDGESLELGTSRLGFSELRERLNGSGADVRLVIIDSCRSGALLAEKGGTPGPGFQIRLSDEVASTGEALLTSSAADEMALESREIRGSFFTHHLVSGLRGAADASGDGQVTLAEAYQYAFSHTVTATASTLPGPQHPAYDYRLAGQGELVLASLTQPDAAILLPSGFERILVINLDRDQVMAELPTGASLRLAVPAGTYGVRGWRGKKAFAARVVVDKGAARVVRNEELAAAALYATTAKGGEIQYVFPTPRRTPPPILFAAVGASGGISTAALGSARLGVRWPGLRGFAVNLTVSSGRGTGYYETAALAWLGYRLGFARGRLGGFLGVEIGAGLISQDVDRLGARRTATVGVALWPGLSINLTSRLAVALEAELPVQWVRKDGRDTVAWLPAGWLGLLVRL